MSTLELLAGRHVAFLNWRDRANPAAGGAESYTEEIARRFGAAGARVTLVTSSFAGASPYDWSEGYLVLRKGGQLGVYLAAARHLRRHAHRYDAVVDFQNGIPFFAPLWCPPRLPVVCVVHHVHQKQFNLYFPWPLNRVGRYLEGPLSRRIYGDRPMVAVSPSTRAEMRRQLGFRGPVHIVPNGLDPPRRTDRPRSPTPAIAVVTRLVPHKQLHHLVEAVPGLLRRWPELRVDIAGTGAARDALMSRAGQLGLEGTITFPGRVSEQAKADLLAQAWLTVAPSAAEGWGLTVLEGNALGTPALAYDVPGLRDSVRHAVTGWLVPPGQRLDAGLVTALEELSDRERQQRMADRAQAWAARFSWDASAERLAGVVLAEIWHQERGSQRRQPVDLAALASWPPDPSGELTRMLRKALRVTDIIASDKDGVRALLIGCDEVGAARALERIPVPPARLRLATTMDVLSGAAWSDGW